MTSLKKSLLTPLDLGSITLTSRIAMAPMTRGRAHNENHVPTALLEKYYAQRSTAGLIITEGTWTSKQAIGFMHVPGIFTTEQAEGWKRVTQAVHQKGGIIFSQLGHVGILSHPDYLNGELPAGPSAVNPGVISHTPDGPKDTVTAREMTVAEIKQTVLDYKNAAQHAKNAGFDGIELHAQSPSILSQFMSDTLNKRTDEYGGSLENKTRLLFEVLDAVTEVWGNHRISVRVNPYLNFSKDPQAPENPLPLYEYVIKKLDNYQLAFLHILDWVPPGVSKEEQEARKIYQTVRPWYKGLIMANGGLTKEKANHLISTGLVDLVSFGNLYIANPDLVQRFKDDLILNEGDPATFITGDEKGYVDYPFASAT